VQAITGKVHGLRRFSFVQLCKNVLNRRDQVGSYSAEVVMLVKPFEAAMLKTPYHRVYTVKCTLSLVTDRLLQILAAYTACPAICSSLAISAMIAAASSSSEVRMD
jgi:hypothetical protein